MLIWLKFISDPFLSLGRPVVQLYFSTSHLYHLASLLISLSLGSFLGGNYINLTTGTKKKKNQEKKNQGKKIGYKKNLFSFFSHACVLNLTFAFLTQLGIVIPLTLFVIVVHNWVLGSFICYTMPIMQVSLSMYHLIKILLNATRNKFRKKPWFWCLATDKFGTN